MYQAERLDLIARAVREAGRVSVRELAERFDITTETVRRDLQSLEESGSLQRVHGGAIAVRRTSLVERDLGERLAAQGDEKKRIAERAARAVAEGFSGSIVIDAGTSTAALLDPLLARISGGTAQIVTNAVAHAAAIAGREGISLTVLGGRVRTVTGATVGIETVRDIERLRPDVAFIGTNAVSVEFGFSTPDVDEAAIKTAMAGAARRVIMLADSSKFGDESLTRFADLGDIDVLVTDAAPPADLAEALENADVEVWIA